MCCMEAGVAGAPPWAPPEAAAEVAVPFPLAAADIVARAAAAAAIFCGS